MTFALQRSRPPLGLRGIKRVTGQVNIETQTSLTHFNAPLIFIFFG